MSGGPNPVAGEAGLVLAGRAVVLRPSFGALVAAEGELGPLLPLVDRAAEGAVSLAEMVGLFWHCLTEREGWTREAFGEAVVALGLAKAMPALRIILTQILAGSA